MTGPPLTCSVAVNDGVEVEVSAGTGDNVGDGVEVGIGVEVGTGGMVAGLGVEVPGRDVLSGVEVTVGTTATVGVDPSRGTPAPVHAASTIQVHNTMPRQPPRNQTGAILWKYAFHTLKCSLTALSPHPILA
jgi:hypothetical protein